MPLQGQSSEDGGAPPGLGAPENTPGCQPKSDQHSILPVGGGAKREACEDGYLPPGCLFKSAQRPPDWHTSTYGSLLHEAAEKVIYLHLALKEVLSEGIRLLLGFVGSYLQPGLEGAGAAALKRRQNQGCQGEEEASPRLGLSPSSSNNWRCLCTSVPESGPPGRDQTPTSQGKNKTELTRTWINTPLKVSRVHQEIHPWI